MRISLKTLRNLIVETIIDDYHEKFRMRMQENAEKANILFKAVQKIATLLPCNSTISMTVSIADRPPKEFNNIEEAIEYARDSKQNTFLRICLFLEEFDETDEMMSLEGFNFLSVTCHLDGYQHDVYGKVYDNTESLKLNEKQLLKQASCASFDQFDSRFKEFFSNCVRDFNIEIKGDVEVNLDESIKKVSTKKLSRHQFDLFLEKIIDVEKKISKIVELLPIQCEPAIYTLVKKTKHNFKNAKNEFTK